MAAVEGVPAGGVVTAPGAQANRLRIASRASRLALAQLAEVEAKLTLLWPSVELVRVLINTKGDGSLLPFSEIDSIGVFSSALEEAVLTGEADLAVHSLKDLPTTVTDQSRLIAVLARSSPWDVLVTRDGQCLAELAPGSRVGTSSPRRQAFLALARPDLELIEIRGNVDSRLRQLDAGALDGLVLAEAGLMRLGVRHPWERLGPQILLPAAGQGAIALQSRRHDPAVALVGSLTHQPTLEAVTAERACLWALGGGCNLPLGVWADTDQGRLSVRGRLIRAGQLAEATADGLAADAQVLGEELGRELARRLGDR